MKAPAFAIADLKEKFKKIFNLDANQFQDKLLSVYEKRFVLDIVKLDDWMVEHEKYDIEKDGSLSDFVTKKYGKEATEFILSIL